MDTSRRRLVDKVGFFNKHAHTWDGERNDAMASRLERVVHTSGARQGERVLDVGTGTGVLIPHILHAVGSEGAVVAVDVSPEMLAQARAKGFPENVSFLQADIEHTGLPDASFHRVICNAAFPHFSDKRHALNEMVRLLLPGGTLIVSHPIGREAVNKVHMDAGDAVAEDRVPPPEAMRELLGQAGLVDVYVIDEPSFYLAHGRKPA